MAAGNFAVGAIIASTLPQQVLAKNSQRNGLIVQNRSLNSIVLQGIAGEMGSDGLEIPSRSQLVLSKSFVPLGVLYLASDVAGSKYAILEGTGTVEEVGPSGLFPFSRGGGSGGGGVLPAPSPLTLGGVYAEGAPSSSYQTGVDLFGHAIYAQPTFSNIAGVVASTQLPTPTTTALGGVLSSAALANQFQRGIDTTGAPVYAQPSFNNLSGSATAAQMPAYTGDVTSVAGSTVNNLATVNANTGSFGGASSVPTFTVNAKGLLTAAGAIAVVAPAGTLTGAMLATGVTASSLTSVGTIATGTWNGARVGNAYVAQAPTLTLRGNLTGATADVADSALSAHMDAAFGNPASRGTIIVKGATGFVARTPNATGQVPTFDGTDTNFANPGTAVAPPRSNIRQTVQGGPQSAGAPNFLPATSASLTLTGQNVSTGTNALTVAAAQGYNSTGQNDVIIALTSNPSWTTTASATSYLFINASTGATSVQTLAPIYQFGGTASTTSGQFTFDYQAMIGYLGNGTAAVVTPLVVVGEAVASASAVTSTIAYAYNGYYDSGFTNTLPGVATVVTRNSNLGIVPQRVNYQLQCLTADAGYSVGDNLYITSTYDGQFISTIQTYATRNTAGFSTASTSPAFRPYNKTTGAGASLTAANWQYKILAQRGW